MASPANAVVQENAYLHHGLSIGIGLLALHLVGFAPLFFGEREFVRWDDKEIFESDEFWRGVSPTHIAADFQATL
jgi:hypothetical protein